MTAAMTLLATLLLTAGPAEDFLARFAALGPASTKAKILPFLAPTEGVQVDTATEGSSVQRFETVTTASTEKDFQRVLGPLFASGVLKATPSCNRQPPGFHCTLMTSTSLPRVFELKEVGGKLYLLKVYWAVQGGDDDDDDDLPL